MLAFCKRKATERNKPYVRLNLHNDSTAARMAIALGARQGTPYAWQIKIPDAIRFLTAIAPVLEARMAASCFRGYSGTLRMDFFRAAVDLVWDDGILGSVERGAGEVQHALSLNADLFPALCLSYRTWPELRYVRPDIIPRSATAALLIETLFPALPSWIHQQY
jgi:hypothetical protein